MEHLPAHFFRDSPAHLSEGIELVVIFKAGFVWVCSRRGIGAVRLRVGRIEIILGLRVFPAFHHRGIGFLRAALAPPQHFHLHFLDQSPLLVDQPRVLPNFRQQRPKRRGKPAAKCRAVLRLKAPPFRARLFELCHRALELRGPPSPAGRVCWICRGAASDGVGLFSSRVKVRANRRGINPFLCHRTSGYHLFCRVLHSRGEHPEWLRKTVEKYWLD